MITTCYGKFSQPKYFDKNNCKNIRFGRMLNDPEFKGCSKAIYKAFYNENSLNKLDLALIMPDSSLPSIPDQDTSIGSLNSKGGREFIDFIAKNGFNNVQRLPEGITTPSDPSPYRGSIFSTNPLSIDLPALKNSKYGDLLGKEGMNDIKEIISKYKKITEKNPDRANRILYERFDKDFQCVHWGKDSKDILWEGVHKEHEKVLRKAFENFDINIKAFNDFKTDPNNQWLEKDALYEVLAKEHNNDFWLNWQGENAELDKNLWGSKKDTSEANSRIKDLKDKYSNDIEFYKFCQFIADDQKKETLEYNKKLGIKTKADAQVAFSNRDWWANPNVFLDPKFRLGCPDGQRWGFPILDPTKLFKKSKDELGESGKLLKARFDKTFRENSGGVRIDHIIGLIDPWAYLEGKKPMPIDGAKRIFSSPEGGPFKQYAHIKPDQIRYEGTDNEGKKIKIDEAHTERVKKLTGDDIKKYARILTDIVFKSAEENGIEKSSVICEDLGTLTKPVREVMKKLDLSGIRVTQCGNPKDPKHLYRGHNVEPRHWITIGTHDNTPTRSWIRELYEKFVKGEDKNADPTNKYSDHAEYLADNIVDPKEKDEFLKIVTSKDKKNEDKAISEFATAKFVEEFASPSKHIQVNFADYAGFDSPYNIPGTQSNQNWTLRIPNDYKKFYYEQLEKGRALNLPDVLAKALNLRGSNLTAQNKALGDEFIAKNKALIEELKDYAGKLKEPESGKS
ncbi:MAG: 4-alpha-glucanotransferase [bacterium]